MGRGGGGEKEELVDHGVLESNGQRGGVRQRFHRRRDVAAGEGGRKRGKIALAAGPRK